MLKSITVTDTHYGHPRLSSATMLMHFLEWYKENESLLDEVDVIFMDGDLFEKSLELHNKAVYHAYSFLASLAEICIKNSSKLRVLDGTNSHDVSQAHLVRLFSRLNKKLDVKWIKDITLEVIDGISILYVPDEMYPHSADTLKACIKLLSDNDLKKADMIHIHSGFRFNLPPQAHTDSTFIEEDWLRICNGLIVNGHIHPYGEYEDIRTCGSFDRLSFGEEEDKGGMYVEVTKSGNHIDYTTRRLINKSAATFSTIKVDESIPYLDSLKEVRAKVHTLLRDETINVRLKVSRSYGANMHIDIENSFTDVRCVSKYSETKNVTEVVIDDANNELLQFSRIDQGNIRQAFEPYLNELVAQDDATTILKTLDNYI